MPRKHKKLPVASIKNSLIEALLMDESLWTGVMVLEHQKVYQSEALRISLSPLLLFRWLMWKFSFSR